VNVKDTLFVNEKDVYGWASVLNGM